MSNPIAGVRPLLATPTTPPAGPERIASLPWNSSAAVSPPDDIMNMRRVGLVVSALLWRTASPLAAACSLPPCGGGVGRGVVPDSVFAVFPSLSLPPKGGGDAGAAALIAVELLPALAPNSSATCAT